MSQFMARELPCRSEVLNEYREQLPKDVTAVSPDPPPAVRAAHGTIAAALDHRLRYALSETEPLGAVALGVQKSPAPLRRIGEAVLTHLAYLLQEHLPASREHPIELSGPAEEAFDRACYACALFEEVYRTGRVWPNTPLGQARSQDELLGAVPAYAVADLRSLVGLAEGGLGAHLPWLGAQLRRSTPTGLGRRGGHRDFFVFAATPAIADRRRGKSTAYAWTLAMAYSAATVSGNFPTAGPDHIA